MTGSIRNFEKLNFTPKSSVFCFSQGQTSEYDRLAHQDRTALLAFDLYLKIANSNFSLLFQVISLDFKMVVLIFIF